MTTRTKSWILPLILAIVSVIVIGASLALRFLDLDTYKAQIVAQVRKELKRELSYSSGDFSFRYGPAFTFSDITIKEKDGVTDFVKANRLTIRLAVIPLLRKELVLSRMQLDHPVLELSRDRNGVFNVSDVFERPSGSPPPAIRGVELIKAQVRFTDQAVSELPVVTELSGADLYLSRMVPGKECDFKLSGSLISGAAKVPVFLAGVMQIPSKEKPFTSCEINGRVRTGPLDAAHFWPYYSKYVPFKSLGGAFALEGNFKGRPSAFKSKGDLQVTRLNMEYPQIFHARLTPRSIKLSYHMELTDRDLDVTSVKADVDGLKVDGSCKLSNIHSKDLRITARATTNRFNLRDFRQFIPYGVIVKDTADFIERKISGGVYRLDEGRLDGTISQILHMERGTNYNILHVKAHVEDGIVTYGGGFPVVSAIKGELQLAGKDFVLQGMTANFGTSPMTLDGRIADYPLVTPCSYLFTANVRPRQREAAWVLGKSGDKMTLSDGATMKVTGSGTTALYTLAGDCDLGAASYTVPGLISKPQGRPNTLSYKVSFGKDEYRISPLIYHLAPLALSMSSVARYDGPVSLELKTNQFQSAQFAPFAPSLAKYRPSGLVQAHLRASGPGLDRLKWGGNVALAGVSLMAGEKVKPLTGINGTLQFNGEDVESSQISARLGSSSISGRGSLSGFKSPTFSLSFYSPLLDLADLGFGPAPGKAPLRVERVQGTISYNREKDALQIAGLTGTLGRSTLQLKGGAHDLQRHPQIDITVGSPHLELDDITPLFGGSAGSGSRPTIKAQIYATEGKALDIPFQRLKTTVLLEDGIVYLQPMELNALDGTLSGKLKIEFPPGPPRYQVSLNMQKASAERVMHVIGAQKEELTGSMTVVAELVGSGDNAAQFRKSATGAVDLKVEHGTIKRFSTMSKIFSILNVSQLFRFHLPDMVSGGMPYNKISGDFALHEGIATTKNLLLDSNAIKFSAVGKVDLHRDELDFNIAAQPLQTVDKVVRRIPIIGYVIAGDDHSFVTTSFEARGKIEDPNVTAVPFKSLGKGVLNTFKRLLSLPKRLITDTGEVLIGE
jgi:uncharacterized protein YhdP